MSVAAITNRIAVALVLLTTLLSVSASWAQSTSLSDRRPMVVTYPAASSYPVAWGYGGYHASTAAEGVLNGRAALVDELGNYDLDDAQAGILREQARAMDRENDLKQTKALEAQKKMWEDARIQERKDRDARLAEGQQLLAQRRATIYRQAYQLSARELNLKTGAICWPAALQGAKFAENRARLDELFRQHIGYGAPQAVTANEIARTVDQWARELRHDVASMPREDYLAAQKFLLGLKYGAESLVQTT
jgi:hypothetical protein